MHNWRLENLVSTRMFDRATGVLLWEDIVEPASNFYKSSWWEPDDDLMPWVRKNIKLTPEPIVPPPDPTALKAFLLENN